MMRPRPSCELSAISIRLAYAAQQHDPRGGVSGQLVQEGVQIVHELRAHSVEVQLCKKKR